MNREHWSVMTAIIDGCYWEDPASKVPSTLFVGHYIVAYSYSVDGNRHRSEFHSSHVWEKGTDLMIAYNPKNQGESIVCEDDESEQSAAVEGVFGVLEVIISLL
jgi:hypothetical protein